MKLFFVKMKIFFSKIFGIEKRKGLIADFCSTVNNYFADIEHSRKSDKLIWRHYTHLRDIKVEVKKDKIIYFITVFQPGIFIGPRGNYINNIKARLEKIFHTQIEINVKEWRDPWGW